MRIFIAGATGTLGIPLVRELTAQGHQVTGLARTDGKRQLLAGLGARVAVADALDEHALFRAVETARPELVIHLLTAIPKRGPVRAEDMEETNHLRFRGTSNLLRASIVAKAKRIIAESMIFAYGFGDHGDGKLTEKDELQPREKYAPAQGTVNALRYLERSLLAAGRKGLIRPVVLRFGLLYGPEVPATDAALQMILERKMPVLTSGDGKKPWIHLDDAVSAIVAAVRKGGAGEIYNIVDDEPAGYRDFILYAARVLGAPRPRNLPLWFMRLTTPYTAAALSTRLEVSNGKAKKELGWKLRFPNYRAGLQTAATRLLRRKAA